MNDGTKLRTVRFEAPVYIAELHPTNQSVEKLEGMRFPNLFLVQLPVHRLPIRRPADAGRHLKYDSLEAPVGFSAKTAET